MSIHKNKHRGVRRRSCRRGPHRLGYNRIDLVMSLGRVNIVGTIAAFLMSIIAGYLGFLCFGPERWNILQSAYNKHSLYLTMRMARFCENHGLKDFSPWTEAQVFRLTIIAFVIMLLITVAILFFLTFIHELTHKYTWALGLNKEDRKKITIGIKKMTPYCHCEADQPVKLCFLGTIMPMIITGLLIELVGILIHSPWITIIGAISFGGGGSDIICATRMLPYLKVPGAIAADAENEVGAYIFIPEEITEDEADECPLVSFHHRGPVIIGEVLETNANTENKEEREDRWDLK